MIEDLLSNIDRDLVSVLSPVSITAFDATSVNGGTVVNNGVGAFTHAVSDGLLNDTATITFTSATGGTVLCGQYQVYSYPRIDRCHDCGDGLRLHSASEGQIATFTLLLPLVLAEAAA